MNACSLNQNANTFQIEDFIRNTLYHSKNPQGKQLSNDNKVVKTISAQVQSVSKLSGDEKEVFNLILGSKLQIADMAKNGANPKALIASTINKVLSVSGLVTDSELTRCGIAISIVIVDIAVVSATGPIGALLFLNDVYGMYSSCKAVF